MANAIYKSNRTELKGELYRLLSILNDPFPVNQTDNSQDPAEELGIADDELVELIRSCQAQRDQETALYRRVFPALERDLLFLANRNMRAHGVLGFRPEELSSEANAKFGFDLYSKNSLLRFCRLLGWTIKQDIPESKAGLHTPQALWVPPPGSIKNGD